MKSVKNVIGFLIIAGIAYMQYRVVEYTYVASSEKQEYQSSVDTPTAPTVVYTYQPVPTTESVVPVNNEEKYIGTFVCNNVKLNMGIGDVDYTYFNVHAILVLKHNGLMTINGNLNGSPFQFYGIIGPLISPSCNSDGIYYLDNTRPYTLVYHNHIKIGQLWALEKDTMDVDMNIPNFRIQARFIRQN